MIVQRLPDHILDADVLQTDSGTWFAHAHSHAHPDPSSSLAAWHRHRHDHRRRSPRGDYDHHVIEGGDG